MRLILASVLVLACVAYVASVEHRLSALSEVEVGAMKTTWMSGGVQREVRTTQNAGESLADFQARHFAAVVAKQAEFPPDAP